MIRKNISTIILFAITFLFLFNFYPFFFTEPNQIIPNDKGDCLKSFFVSLGYIKNQPFDSDFLGMNYPYGLTFFYTDGLPVLTILIKLICFIFPKTGDYTIGIYNCSFLLSYFLAVFLFYKILGKFYLNNWFKVLGAFSITMLSPQMFRLLGHPSLVYVAFFPLSWYLLLKFFEGQKRPLITILIMLNSILWFFMHPYYQMIIMMFYLFVWVFYFFRSSDLSISQKATYFILQTFIPVLSTKFFVVWMDHHSLRPQIPGGFFDYFARLETVFVPYMSPLTVVFKTLFRINTERQIWEGWAYIGLPAVLMTVFLLLRMVKKFFWSKNKKTILNPPLPNYLFIYFWPAFIILLFSMCIPFKWGLSFLLDWIPFIKQFRALGRFAWVFYNVYSVLSIVFLFLIYKKLNGKKNFIIARSIVFLYFSVMICEAYGYHKIVADSITSKNPFLQNKLNHSLKISLHEIQKQKPKFQCIIPLPFFHSGCEEFETGGSEMTSTISMLLSYWSDIPLMASATARTSIEEGKNILNFFAPPFMDHKFRNKFSSSSFLILFTKTELNYFQNELLKKAKPFAKFDEFELYELPYDSVFNNSFNKYEWLKMQHPCYVNEMDSAYLSRMNIPSRLCSNVISINFDSSPSDKTFLGNGSTTGIVGDYNVLLERGNYNLKPNKDYTISGWYLYEGEKSNHNHLIIEESDSSNKNSTWPFAFSATETFVSSGNWIFIQNRFQLQKEKEFVKIFFKGADNYRKKFCFDELVIRQSEENVLTIKKNKEGISIVLFNNIPFDTLKNQ